MHRWVGPCELHQQDSTCDKDTGSGQPVNRRNKVLHTFNSVGFCCVTDGTEQMVDLCDGGSSLHTALEIAVRAH